MGLCKGNKNWASTLRDLQYNVEIIEQSIRTTGNGSQLVKPDVIKISKKRNHAIIIDCKSGGLEEEQLRRYESLTKDDVLRWVDVPSKEQFTFDVCIADFDTNHDKIKNNTVLPVITFNKESITKTNTFSESDLDRAFENPINIAGMMPTLDYYPFSELDADPVIIPRLLRMMIVLTMKRSRGGHDLFNQEIFSTDEILEKIHPLWQALSQEHKETLRKRIRDLIGHLLHSYKELSEQLHNMQRDGYTVRGPPEKFTALCEQIIANAEGSIEKWFK